VSGNRLEYWIWKEAIVCWFIVYRENKISVANLIDYSCYKKVNIIENEDNIYPFQIYKMEIDGTLYYDIRNNQCACDFFSTKKQSVVLRDAFVQFIRERMKNPCVEPIVASKWIGNEEFSLPKDTLDVNTSDIEEIFKRARDCVYRIVR
jgi:hypothetical protein